MHIYKKFTSIVAAVLLSIGLPLEAGAAEEKILNIYNWSDYIAEDTIKNFDRGFQRERRSRTLERELHEAAAGLACALTPGAEVTQLDQVQLAPGQLPARQAAAVDRLRGERHP